MLDYLGTFVEKNYCVLKTSTRTCWAKTEGALINRLLNQNSRFFTEAMLAGQGKDVGFGAGGTGLYYYCLHDHPFIFLGYSKSKTFFLKGCIKSKTMFDDLRRGFSKE